LGPFPQELGWHPRGVGAMAGCVGSAVLGMVAVGWCAWGRAVEVEVERGVRRGRERREMVKGWFGGKK
jgi:iron transport multicopper oxidase